MFSTLLRTNSIVWGARRYLFLAHALRDADLIGPGRVVGILYLIFHLVLVYS